MCSKSDLEAFVTENSKDGDLFFMRRSWHPLKSFADILVAVKDGIAHVAVVLRKDGIVWVFDASLGGPRTFTFRQYLDRYETFEYACLYRPRHSPDTKCLFEMRDLSFKYAGLRVRGENVHSCTSLARKALVECNTAARVHGYTDTWRDGVFPSSLMRLGDSSGGEVLFECGERSKIKKHRFVSLLVVASVVFVLARF